MTFTFVNFSDENCFVTGSKNGIVTVWNDSTPRWREVFKNCEKWYNGGFVANATFVRYANNKIFAIGRYDTKLQILNSPLYPDTLKVVDHEFDDWIRVLVASDNYVAIGDESGNVTIFNHNGDRVLVSYF